MDNKVFYASEAAQPGASQSGAENLSEKAVASDEGGAERCSREVRSVEAGETSEQSAATVTATASSACDQSGHLEFHCRPAVDTEPEGVIFAFDSGDAVEQGLDDHHLAAAASASETVHLYGSGDLAAAARGGSGAQSSSAASALSAQTGTRSIERGSSPSCKSNETSLNPSSCLLAIVSLDDVPLHGFKRYVADTGSVYEGEWVEGRLEGTATAKHSSGDVYTGDFKHSVRHGYGELVCGKGDSYVGHWVDGKKGGQGKYTYAQGGCYEGQWKNDKRHGYGVMKNYSQRQQQQQQQQAASGAEDANAGLPEEPVEIYEGEWRNGVMHGQGSYKFLSGSVYEGSWVDGKMEGKGRYFYRDGNLYEGQCHENMKHGFGTLTYKEGGYYAGSWSRDQPHGVGKFVSKSGSIYQGEWKNGRVHGKGVYRYKDGRIYDGEWVGDKKQGVGILTYPDGSMYEGYWENNQPHGNGRFVSKDSHTYEGWWSQGVISGRGRHKFPNGAIYDGNFENNVKKGCGLVRSLDGTVYNGEWLDNKPHGAGTLKFPDGTSMSLLWKGGKATGVNRSQVVTDPNESDSSTDRVLCGFCGSMSSALCEIQYRRSTGGFNHQKRTTSGERRVLKKEDQRSADDTTTVSQSSVPATSTAEATAADSAPIAAPHSQRPLASSPTEPSTQQQSEPTVQTEKQTSVAVEPPHGQVKANASPSLEVESGGDDVATQESSPVGRLPLRVEPRAYVAESSTTTLSDDAGSSTVLTSSNFQSTTQHSSTTGTESRQQQEQQQQQQPQQQQQLLQNSREASRVSVGSSAPSSVVTKRRLSESSSCSSYFIGTVINNVRTGYGVYTYRDGGKYSGDWKNNLPHGYGKYEGSTGVVYVGEWNAGQIHGRGRYTYPDGSFYDGDCQGGKKHGTGTLTAANGTTHTGTWESDRPHGQGRYTSPSTGTSYVGEWHYGVMQGIGTFQYSSGSVYTGAFAGGDKSGHGVMRYEDGSVYDGEWSKDRAHGFGTYTWADGVHYNGQWVAGKMQGSGEAVFTVQNTVVSGKWQDNQMHGHGRIVFNNGACYEGEWARGVPHGSGRFTTPQGAKFAGRWRDGRLLGKGRKVDESGNYVGSEFVATCEDDEQIIAFGSPITPSEDSKAAPQKFYTGGLLCELLWKAARPIVTEGYYINAQFFNESVEVLETEETNVVEEVKVPLFTNVDKVETQVFRTPITAEGNMTTETTISQAQMGHSNRDAVSQMSAEPLKKPVYWETPADFKELRETSIQHTPPDASFSVQTFDQEQRSSGYYGVGEPSGLEGFPAAVGSARGAPSTNYNNSSMVDRKQIVYMPGNLRIVQGPLTVIEEETVIVPGDTIIREVEVPQVHERVLLKEVKVPQYVEKPVFEYEDTEVFQDIHRLIPVPVEIQTICNFEFPRIRPMYKEYSYPIYAPRYVEVPVPEDMLDENVRVKCQRLCECLDALASHSAPSIAEYEDLAREILQLQLIPPNLTRSEAVSRIERAFREGRLPVYAPSLEALETKFAELRSSIRMDREGVLSDITNVPAISTLPDTSSTTSLLAGLQPGSIFVNLPKARGPLSATSVFHKCEERWPEEERRVTESAASIGRTTTQPSQLSGSDSVPTDVPLVSLAPLGGAESTSGTFVVPSSAASSASAANGTPRVNIATLSTTHSQHDDYMTNAFSLSFSPNMREKVVLYEPPQQGTAPGAGGNVAIVAGGVTPVIYNTTDPGDFRTPAPLMEYRDMNVYGGDLEAATPEKGEAYLTDPSFPAFPSGIKDLSQRGVPQIGV